MSKATSAEINLRVSEVQDLLLKGHTRTFILNFGSKWNVGDRQIDEYIAQASKIIKEINLSTAHDNLALITSSLWQIFRTQLLINPELARKILMDIAKLRGLDEQTINHIIEDKRELSEVSDADLEKLLGQDTSTPRH